MYGSAGQGGETELEQAVAVGSKESAARTEGGDTFRQGADEFRTGMEAQDDRMFERGGEQLVLDHQRGHAHQGHGVLVIAAPVRADVEHADDLALVVGDWDAEQVRKWFAAR